MDLHVELRRVEGKDFGLDPDPVFNLLYVIGFVSLAVLPILLD